MEITEIAKRRLIACIVDYVLVGGVALICYFPLMILRLPSLINSVFAAMIFVFFGFVLLVKDGPTWFIEFLRGQSPGKKQFSLIVTKSDGKTNISWQDSINRNLPLIAPYILAIFLQFSHAIIPYSLFFINIFLALGGCLICFLILAYEVFKILTDPEGRRWGDQRADTKVIDFI